MSLICIPKNRIRVGRFCKWGGWGFERLKVLARVLCWDEDGAGPGHRE